MPASNARDALAARLAVKAPGVLRRPGCVLRVVGDAPSAGRMLNRLNTSNHDKSTKCQEDGLNTPTEHFQRSMVWACVSRPVFRRSVSSFGVDFPWIAGVQVKFSSRLSKLDPSRGFVYKTYLLGSVSMISMYTSRQNSLQKKPLRIMFHMF